VDALFDAFRPGEHPGFGLVWPDPQ
jgi:hypothetical protein